MEFKPHEYQAFAIDYLKTHDIAALLLDMGLGKTVITLTALNDLLYDSFEVKKVLIIAPLRVARDTWPNEINKWEHLRNLKYSVIVGDRDERKRALRTKADIYIINRENVPWLINESHTDFDFDMVIIDELSSFKSIAAKRFKALMKVRPRVTRIVGLTGTPASNGLMDLFAEFKLLDMGERLGKFITNYRNLYFKPDKRNGAIIYNWKPNATAEDEIYRKIADITVSMKATDHLKMPDLISTSYQVTLSEAETKKYKELRDEAVMQLEGEELTAVTAGVLVNKLTQLANGAIYSTSGGVLEFHDKKLDALEDLIEAANGKPILIAYWYKHDLVRIKKRFPDTVELKTSESMDKWNKREIPVALIHPASAGHGLNLQAGGNTMVWYGLTWSLELYQQANARLYRQGQTESSVVIQHIVTKGTVDEQILRALQNKDKTQAALIDAVRANIGGRYND